MALLLSTAYAPPLSYMALLYKHQGKTVYIEGAEHIVKQSWRNRCDVASSQGIQSLSIPIERPQGNKTFIRDVQISHNKAWRHQHIQALKTNYSCSPFFEYYWDDIYPLYVRKYQYLWDFNWELLMTFLRLFGLSVDIKESVNFCPVGGWGGEDYRYVLHPRKLDRSLLHGIKQYYQPFWGKQGFIPELSIYDLLMNMGPESLLYLRDYKAEIWGDGYNS